MEVEERISVAKNVNWNWFSSKNNGFADPKEKEKTSQSWRKKKGEKIQFEKEVLHLQIYLSFTDTESVHFPYIYRNRERVNNINLEDL